ncbi:MAG: glycoside hydrolase family 15 protein [Hyphomicrobiaceae bacterium]|nr:glycoside hydrolase family 15 protein [Hyphomicrobiaceae bacterium]
MPGRIEDYALISDCETAALVSRTGSIDWLCWPRFDSDACFAALLGTSEHGRWLIAPSQPDPGVRRRYRDGTLILETDFETSEGAVRLVDFMFPRPGSSDLVRLVVGLHGRVRMRASLVLRFGYGNDVPWVSRLDDHTMRMIDGPDMAVLRTPVRLRGESFRTVCDFTVEPGETVPFTLSHTASHLPPPPPLDAEKALADTEAMWRQWSSRCASVGPWTQAVKRSLLVLKALTYAPTGGIAAAPTTSLPEKIGGTRNWDYRYCWLRDAPQTLRALMDTGYFGEARAWRDWLVRAVAGSPSQMQIMYGLAGERRLTEWEVSWLPGYEGSRPVRVGNEAHRQTQLDVFGEIMDTLFEARAGGIDTDAVAWGVQRELLHHLEKIWREPDFSLWEIRSEPRQFTYSKVMAWVAFDRGVRAIESFELDGPLDRWRNVRDEIRDQVLDLGYDSGLGSFVQCYGSRELDASLLLIPSVGLLPPGDGRVDGTVRAIERELMSDGLVRRYHTHRTEDGLPPGEGAFLACSFWLVDAYVLTGRLDEACRLFEHLLSMRNDVGLLAEEYDTVGRRMVGNFPQAFSHIALVNSALLLEKSLAPCRQEKLTRQAAE